MTKSLYSLILTDEIVSEIDRLAYKTGTNRSNMINQILAEYVSYTTPEMRMGKVFTALEQMLLGGDNFQRLVNNSVSVMNLRSSLDFKYNPSVKYTVELNRSEENEIGTLKISMRTKNAALITYMMEFYKLFARIESLYVKGTEYYLENDRFVRKLKLRAKRPVTADELGTVIAEYIRVFDNCMKSYFYNINDLQRAYYEIEHIYIAYLRANEVQI